MFLLHLPPAHPLLATSVYFQDRERLSRTPVACGSNHSLPLSPTRVNEKKVGIGSLASTPTPRSHTTLHVKHVRLLIATNSLADFALPALLLVVAYEALAHVCPVTFPMIHSTSWLHPRKDYSCGSYSIALGASHALVPPDHVLPWSSTPLLLHYPYPSFILSVRATCPAIPAPRVTHSICR
jgi:hypothetical protein